MIGARVVTEAEDGIGVVKILQRDGALADANRFWQADTGRFMAHVGTVRKIVRAISADKKLVEKRCFVGGAARCVKFGFIRAVELVELLGDQAESIIPVNLLVAIGFGVVPHRNGEAAGILQIVIGPFPQFGNAVLFEEFRSRSFGGGFPCDGLGAVFTKLEGRGVFWIGPCAARTVKTFRLVRLQQCHRTLRDDLLVRERLGDSFQRSPATGGLIILFDTFRALIFHVCNSLKLHRC